MEAEMNTLEVDLSAWQLVRREPWMHVLCSKWAFRIKRFPNGLVKKFKARFCVRGDMQIEGIDFFETWAPVVSWPTVRALLILATKLELVSVQADITAAFVHAELDEDEHIFVHQAAGFKREGNLVYKLRRSVYGLRQSPRNFFHYLSDKLQNEGLKPSKLDPCLFIGDTVIVVIYVDDVLLYSKSADAIDSLLDNLQAAGVGIRKEGTAEGFLGVDISRDISASGPTITLLQKGLAKRIVEALGLCSQNATAISTPAEASPLPKDADGEPASGTFNYAAVVGMLLYLSGHSRPDIAFAVHQCARYTFKPTRRHELALIRIGRYLKGTLDKGLVMKPCDEPRIDCYPDADFAVCTVMRTRRTLTALAAGRDTSSWPLIARCFGGPSCKLKLLSVRWRRSMSL
jgi:histone deacetylase 1/2